MVRHIIVFSLAVMLLGCNNDSQHLALGTLERDRIAHTAVTNEVVIELPVLAGSMVTKGMLLVRLNDTIQRAKVAKTTADVAQAQAYLDKLKKGPRDEDIAVAKANVAGAKAQLLESEVTYQRLKNLAKKKLVSEAEFDRARAVRYSEQAYLESGKEQLLALTSGTREEIYVVRKRC